jgi:hypothetical protein
MTPEKALEILDEATAMLNVNRATHQQCLQASETIRQAIAPKPVPPKKATEKK